MTTQRVIVAAGLLLLAAGVATSAVLGPLVLGVIEFRLSSGMENQWIGAEVVSLALVAPVAVVAAVLWMRGHVLAPALSIGPALYAIYTYITAVIFPEYDRYPGNNEEFFPLYAGILALSVALVVVSWRMMDFQQPDLTRRARRWIAALLISIAVAIALTWTRQIVDVLADETSLLEYQEHPTGFWTVKLLDFGLILPALVATGVGLLIRHPLAQPVVTPLVGFMGLLIASVAGMAIVMLWRDDPSASVPFAALSTPAAVMLLALFGWLLREGAHAAGTVTQAPAEASRKLADRERREARSPSS